MQEEINRRVFWYLFLFLYLWLILKYIYEQAKLMFASLSMLDVSNNSIKSVPIQIRDKWKTVIMIKLVLMTYILKEY